MAVPIAVAVPVAGGMASAIVALWRKIGKVERQERKDCAERLEKLEERIGNLESDGRHWRDRWVREVERNVKLRSMPTDDSRPRLPPPPEWEENTSVRSQRAVIEQAALDAELRRYADSTPPRQRLPSRPK